MTEFKAMADLISAFEDTIASFQYAKSAIAQLDKDYGMDSSEHIKVLQEFIDAAILAAKKARKELRPVFEASADLNNPTHENE